MGWEHIIHDWLRVQIGLVRGGVQLISTDFATRLCGSSRKQKQTFFFAHAPFYDSQDRSASAVRRHLRSIQQGLARRRETTARARPKRISQDLMRFRHGSVAEGFCKQKGWVTTARSPESRLAWRRQQRWCCALRAGAGAAPPQRQTGHRPQRQQRPGGNVGRGPDLGTSEYV